MTNNEKSSARDNVKTQELIRHVAARHGINPAEAVGLLITYLKFCNALQHYLRAPDTELPRSLVDAMDEMEAAWLKADGTVPAQEQIQADSVKSEMLELLHSLRVNLTDMLEWASIDAGTDAALLNQIAAIDRVVAKAERPTTENHDQAA